MLYIYVIQHSASPLGVHNDYFLAATRCQSHIAAIAEKGSLSERYGFVLEELRVEALRQMKNTHSIEVSTSSAADTQVPGVLFQDQTIIMNHSPDASPGLAEFDPDLGLDLDGNITGLPFPNYSEWEQFTSLLSAGLGNMESFIGHDFGKM